MFRVRSTSTFLDGGSSLFGSASEQPKKSINIAKGPLLFLMYYHLGILMRNALGDKLL